MDQLQQKKEFTYESNNRLTRFIINELNPLYQVLKNKFGECPQAILFKNLKPLRTKNRLSQIEYQMANHIIESDQQKKLSEKYNKAALCILHKIANYYFKCLKYLNYVNDSEYQGIIHLLTFVYTNDQIYSFVIHQNFLIKNPFKYHHIQRLRRLCDIYVQNSIDEEFKKNKMKIFRAMFFRKFNYLYHINKKKQKK